MKFAVIGDIHGNIYALKAVYKDIQNKNIDFIISTGDLVGYRPSVGIPEIFPEISILVFNIKG